MQLKCYTIDGDCEDLALSELKRLSTLSPQEHVGAIKVEEDMKMVEDGSMKVAATEWVSIPAVKEMAVMNVKEEECFKSSQILFIRSDNRRHSVREIKIIVKFICSIRQSPTLGQRNKNHRKFYLFDRAMPTLG
jgi:hypothetical protein